MVPALTIWLALVAAQSTTSPEPPKPATRAEQAAILARTPCDPNSNENVIGMKGMATPMVLYQIEPEVTPEEKATHFSGGPLVQLTVDAQGLSTNVEILKSSSEIAHIPADKKDKALQAAALARDRGSVEAIKQYRFKPATCQGKPVPVRLYIEVNVDMF